MSLDKSTVLASAEKHLLRGKITAAIQEYRKVVNWDPTDLAALNTLGDMYVRAGLASQAKATFCKVAQGYRHQKFTAKAIATLKKVLRLDPADLDTAAKLAELYAEHGLRVEAVEQYLSMAEAHMRAHRGHDALNACRTAVELEPSNASLMMTLGEAQLREQLASEAHETFMRAGEKYFRRGDSQPALGAYSKALAVHADSRAALEAISKVLVAQGHVDRAIAILCEAFERNPGDVPLLKTLGSTYLAAGLIDEAERTFLGLMALDSSQHSHLLEVGNRFLEMGDLDRAAEQVDAFVDVLIDRREEEEAVEFLRRVLERDPSHVGSLERLAQIQRRLREDYNLAVTLNALVDVAMERGDQQEAVQALKELATIEPYEFTHRQRLQSLCVGIAVEPEGPDSMQAMPERTSDYCTTSEDCSVTEELLKANVLSARGQVEEAAVVLIELLKREPDNLKVHLGLKDIYARAGLVEMETNECLQIARITKAMKASESAAWEFTSADRLRELIRSLPPNIGIANIDFELITSINRRHAERAVLRLPLIVFGADGGWREFTESVDVSELGIRVRLAHPVQPQSCLRIALGIERVSQVSGRSRSVYATTSIVRHARQARDELNLVGIEFVPELDYSQQFSAATLDQPLHAPSQCHTF